MKAILIALFMSLYSSSLLAQEGENTKEESPHYPWQTIHIEQKLDQQQLKSLWSKLHKEDGYPYPSTQNLKTRLSNNQELAKRYQSDNLEALAQKQQQAWLAFHNGELEKAYNLGLELGHFGAIVATHARFLNLYYVRVDRSVRAEAFSRAKHFIEPFYAHEPNYPAMQFAYAHIYSRYLQEQSFSPKRILDYRALNKLLKTILSDNPDHLGANLLLAGFHAEGAIKSKFLARIRYGSSKHQAIQSFNDALKLAPHSIMGNAAYALQLIRFKNPEYELMAQAKLEQLLQFSADDANEMLAKRYAQKLLSAIKQQQIPDFIYF